MITGGENPVGRNGIRHSLVIPDDGCYLGWQESLAQLSRLVNPEVRDQ
jgi:hypothetical protein